MILKDTATFIVLLVFLFCAWNITTTVLINSGVYLLRNIMNACEESTVDLLIVAQQVQHYS